MGTFQVCETMAETLFLISMKTIAILSLSFLSIFTLLVNAAPKKVKRINPMTPIEEVKGLPNVLIIGDSISIGYTLPTRALLKEKVNLHRIPTNGGPTTKGLSEIEKWLGNKKWDLIHFNWGLHDLKYMGKDGTGTQGKGRSRSGSFGRLRKKSRKTCGSDEKICQTISLA